MAFGEGRRRLGSLASRQAPASRSQARGRQERRVGDLKPLWVDDLRALRHHGNALAIEGLSSRLARAGTKRLDRVVGIELVRSRQERSRDIEHQERGQEARTPYQPHGEAIIAEGGAPDGAGTIGSRECDQKSGASLARERWRA